MTVGYQALEGISSPWIRKGGPGKRVGLCPSPAWGSLPEWQWATGLVDSRCGKTSAVLPLKGAVRSFIHKLSPGASPLGRFPNLPRLNLFPESEMSSLLSLYGGSSI